MSTATLTIEDSDTPGCVNVHYVMGPALDEGSPAHNLMARVLSHLQALIGEEMVANLPKKEAANG